MPERSRLIDFFAGLLRVLLVLNVACAVLFLVGLTVTLPIGPGDLDRIAANLGSGVDISMALAGVRAVLGIGLLAVVAAHFMLRALRDIALTVRAGDPFQLANAPRIRTVGWTLIALQLLDLVFGAITAWMAAAGVEWVGWTPSLTGWLAALAAFVLAEVWARGAAMRDDLAGTV